MYNIAQYALIKVTATSRQCLIELKSSAHDLWLAMENGRAVDCRDNKETSRTLHQERPSDKKQRMMLWGKRPMSRRPPWRFQRKTIAY